MLTTTNLGIKRCSKCKTWKPFDQFYNMKSNKNGKDAYCKPCRHAIGREYTKRYTPEQRARRKEQQRAHCIRKYGVPYPPSKFRKRAAT